VFVDILPARLRGDGTGLRNEYFFFGNGGERGMKKRKRKRKRGGDLALMLFP
jgi:hypothetical protein